ncbi:cytochrome c oxidase subunit 3 [Azospirillum canadense]|uniref:cytochrome c oxidase subunit 3 n=1 Tax=Azospirillum canadense TaxID=403962 RepID=UPI002226B61C|nr:cytochrome c oxidase subunit 3 [Azospirillum canadense]MCW2238911.1 heme/copper-type cytochrome/quinol oxidase subunit 3 [Azospirillum canadense]
MERAPRFAADLAHLPTSAHGPRATTWWGTLGFILIEATGFALAAAAYFYLMGQTETWPPGQSPPDWLWGTLQLVLMLASLWPNWWTDRVAHADDLRKVRIGLVAMSAVGLLTLVVRAFEFGALNCRWDDNAYGSMVWVLLGLHATHLITDVGDTLVLTVLMFTKHVEPRRFTDVTDNCVYWNFVVAAWVPLWALLYVVPRVV